MCISQASISVAITLRDGNLKCSTKQIPDNTAMSLDGPNPPDRVTGLTGQLCPRHLGRRFSRRSKRVIDLNAEIAYGIEFLSIEAAGDPQLVARPLAQYPEAYREIFEALRRFGTAGNPRHSDVVTPRRDVDS